ncbi:GNAT family N-acetyltransferase [Gordonia sp. NPDC003376]
MISYEWRTELDGEDLDGVLALVETAAAYDAEAGFSHIDPASVRDRDGDGGHVAHLPIEARKDLSPRDDAPLVVVAYLHLSVNAKGLGTVSYVVHPEYRSRGITTLLVEEMGLDTGADGGWAGTGAEALRCWAYATHPASERLTRRFGVPAVSRQWTVARHLTGPFAFPLEKVDLPEGFTLTEARAPEPDDRTFGDVLADAAVAATHQERLGADLARGGGRVVEARSDDGATVGFVWYSTDLRPHAEELRAASVHAVVLASSAQGKGLGSALLVAALENQRDAGAQVSLLRINPDDPAAVRMCRILGYEQEDAHSCYQVGRHADPPPASR